MERLAKIAVRLQASRATLSSPTVLEFDTVGDEYSKGRWKDTL